MLSFPLVVLSGLAVVSGFDWFPVRSMVDSSAIETRAQVSALTGPASPVNPLEHDWPSRVNLSMPDVETDTAPTSAEAGDDRVEAGAAVAGHLTRWAWLAGIIAGVVVYARGFALTERLARIAVLGTPREWLRHRMYFDDLYRWVFIGGARMAGRLIDRLDRRVIDGLIDRLARAYAAIGRATAAADDLVVDGVVRGVSAGVLGSGVGVGQTQGGRVRVYVASAVLMLALTVIGTVTWAVLR